MSSFAEVTLWGSTIGYVSMSERSSVADFEYDKDFIGSGIELSPLRMPLSSRVYQFPELAPASFCGLPGMLSDSLPDRFGHAIIDAWLATQGRAAGSLDPVERLCYLGTRGMGALEFEPALGGRAPTGSHVNIGKLVELASEILTHRTSLLTTLEGREKEKAVRDILRIGSSAGGARAKAVIAWNPHTSKVKSGQINAGEGFEYWMMKFDGVTNNRDKELADPKGYGAIEYAYSAMAKAAGIDMMPCHLFTEGTRRHFMTRRFDRTQGGDKVHMQTLAALAHYDFNLAGAYSYEQALQIIRKLGMGMDEVEEQFRRMAFNIVARNQDDHVKNISFLMDRSGQWALAPAYDVTWSYNPRGAWTSSHQMSLNGKRDRFSRNDFMACAESAGIQKGRAQTILDEVTRIVSQWTNYADENHVIPEQRDQIQESLRLQLP